MPQPVEAVLSTRGGDPPRDSEHDLPRDVPAVRWVLRVGWLPQSDFNLPLVAQVVECPRVARVVVQEPREVLDRVEDIVD